jgi:hypothetical protein
MVLKIRYSEEKNQILKATRGVNFNDVEEILKSKKSQILANLKAWKPRYPNQYTYIIQIKNYAYVVPYVINKQKGELFLKTAYPSRLFTKKYLTKGSKKL